jgi:hypothetical protein
MGKKVSHAMILVLAVCGTLAVGARADITTGLVGYWPLDGDALDASGHGHDGTVQGAVTPVVDRNGSPASAMKFPGQTSAYIDLGQPPELLIKGAMTVSAWVRADTLAQTGRIIAKQGPSSGRSWGLNVETAMFAQFDLGTTPTERVRAQSATLSFGPTDWFHLAGVFRPGESVELYINGELAKKEATTATEQWIENGLPINIGRRPEPGTPWRGDIDEARIYARDLTPVDVKELFAFTPSPRVQAWEPQPADGAVGISIPLLQWKPGMTALLHNVYVGTSPDLGPADLVAENQPAAVYYYAAPLQPGTVYYWRVDEVEQDRTTVHTGNVWSFITQALTAYYPQPADGDGNVSTGVTLTWLAGKNALKHRVYFSDELEAVNQATAEANQGELTETTFQPADLLEATTYYWRIDEVLVDGTIQAGAVWSFSTFLTIEDFESYTDQAGEEIFSTWLDGYLDQSSGSVVGYETAQNGTFGETGIVHGGSQSMPLEYNNVNLPFYSETERTFAPVQDWTVNDADTLVLYVRGRTSNQTVPLYVAVEDSSKKTGTIVHPDPLVVLSAQWLEWKIPFSQFTAAGINLARVQTVRIGLGDRQNPKAGGAGRIYLDDLRVIKSGATSATR